MNPIISQYRSSTLTYAGNIIIVNSQQLYWRLAVTNLVPNAGTIPTRIGFIFK